MHRPGDPCTGKIVNDTAKKLTCFVVEESEESRQPLSLEYFLIVCVSVSFYKLIDRVTLEKQRQRHMLSIDVTSFSNSICAFPWNNHKRRHASVVSHNGANFEPGFSLSDKVCVCNKTRSVTTGYKKLCLTMVLRVNSGAASESGEIRKTHQRMKTCGKQLVKITVCYVFVACGLATT